MCKFPVGAICVTSPLSPLSTYFLGCSSRELRWHACITSIQAPCPPLCSSAAPTRSTQVLSINDNYSLDFLKVRHHDVMQFTPNQTYALYPQLGRTKPFTSPSANAWTSKVISYSPRNKSSVFGGTSLPIEHHAADSNVYVTSDASFPRADSRQQSERHQAVTCLCRPGAQAWS